MPVISTLQTTAVLLDANFEDLLVTTSGAITAGSGSAPAVDATADVTHRKINIGGTISNDFGTAFKIGATLANEHNDIVIASSGFIVAEDAAFEITGTELSFLNAGTIHSAGEIAIQINAKDSTFVNDGVITAFRHSAVSLSGTGSVFVNNGSMTSTNGFLNQPEATVEIDFLTAFINNGTVKANNQFNQAIHLAGSSNMGATNTGTIVGNIVADGACTVDNRGVILGSIQMNSTVSSCVIRNSGHITGSISASKGADVIDLIGGFVGGRVTGAEGNDTYRLDRNDIFLNDFGGTDTVEALVSYRLSFNIENLTLLQQGDISATGNSLDNVLTGNFGDNLIVGRAGSDRLTGSAGNDILIGGTKTDNQIDIFDFNGGDAADIVRGFQVRTANHDVVDLVDFAIEDDFAAFKADHLRQAGKSVVLDLDNGDMLTIESVRLADLKASHFIFDV